MKLLDKLDAIWSGTDCPFLIHNDREVRFSQILLEKWTDLGGIHSGDVVAIVGDFNPPSIALLLRLIDLGAIVVPLTKETAHQHEYFFDTALVDVVVDGPVIK